ncbi:MAG: type II secretion system F family protein [Ignavibacteriales bacterium]|nr:type II secretion system F family protein [Ignavibacteriales bacterium]
MKKISSKEVFEFNRLLGLLLFARMGFVPSLEIIVQKTKNENFKVVLKSIIKDIKSGSGIASSFAKYPQLFTDVYLAALKVAEETGQITDVLNEFVTYNEKMNRLKGKVVTALRYPLFVLFVAIATLLFMVFFLIPSFQGVFASTGKPLPALTETIISITGFIQNHFAVLFFSTAMVIFLSVNYFRREENHEVLYKAVLSMPVISKIYIANILTRFSLNMHILLKNKVTLTDSLKIAKATTKNKMFQREIDSLVKRLYRGESITAKTNDSAFFDITFTKLLFVAEESAELDKAFSLIAEFYTSQFDNMLDAVISMLEPALILFIGAIVAVVLIGMYLPMFELVNNFGF